LHTILTSKKKGHVCG